jgi:type I restriction enzyme, S subunit
MGHKDDSGNGLSMSTSTLVSNGTNEAEGDVLHDSLKILTNDQLRRFKRYPAYKDSGIEWLGEIPVNWNVRPVKRIFRVVNGATPASGESTFWDGDIPWVTPEDLGDLSEARIHEVRRRITEGGYRSCGTTIVPQGSLVLSTRAPIGHLAIAGMDLCTNQGCKSLVFRREISKEYFFYQLLAAKPELLSWGQGSTFQELGSNQLANVPLIEPSASQQRSIAAFLDREIAKLDALVVKKERLIELLQEKRTALVTNAVTKGLDSNAPMKDSGVEWLGQIPAHWTIKPLTKFVLEISDYWGKTPEKVASGVFLVTARNVRMGRIDYDCSQEFIAEEDYKIVMRRGLPKAGDILFTTEAPLGNIALVDREDIALAQRIIRFRMHSQYFDSRFTLYEMMSDAFQVQLQTLSTGSTAEGLKASKLSMLKLIAPPLTEQRSIALFVDRSVERIDDLVEEVRKAIKLLQELRAGLISAAITGKIDVREDVV